MRSDTNRCLTISRSFRHGIRAAGSCIAISTDRALRASSILAPVRSSALPALERTTSRQRRAGDREPPPRPMGGDPFGRTGIPRKPGVCSPPRQSSSTSVARPDPATTIPSSPRPWENSTSRNGLL